jgi:hypothetical protein
MDKYIFAAALRLNESIVETAKFDGKAWSNPKHGHGASAGQ